MIGLLYGLLLAIGILVAIFAIPSMIYVRLAKRPRPISVGLICAVVHACLVLALAIEIYISMRHSNEALMGWMLVDMLDFPSSSIHIGAEALLSGSALDTFWISNFILPLVGGIVFGSLQWGLIATGIASICRKLAPALWHKGDLSNKSMDCTSQ